METLQRTHRLAVTKAAEQLIQPTQLPLFMTLITKLKEEMVLQSLLKNTQSCYEFWNRKFCKFVRISAMEWSGRDVRAFMLWLDDQNYSAVSRKQALNAIKFTFDHVLKAEMGNLDLPPMPQVRQTLRTVPTREEIARILTGLSGQVRLMVALMYGSADHPTARVPAEKLT